MKSYVIKDQDLEVTLLDYGATVHSIRFGGAEVALSYKNIEDYIENPEYLGTTVGRVANRIAGGSFVLDGKEYNLAVNNGPNHLHGGLKGFSDMPWTVEEASDSRLVLSLVSPDGQENYPGTVTVRAIYTVEGRRLTLEMEATTDAPTLVNLTNHAYWNLNGAGTVDTHCLQVNATAYTPMVANIPTGVIAPVAGTLYDLQRPACLGERNAADAIAGGYDDNYVLPTTPGVKIAAVLTNGRRTLRVLTDAPGLQVYTGDYLPLPRGGVALEAQNFPDSPHNPHFPTIELRPGQVYARTIAWEID
jgi:aldose 1-epimerase